MFGEDVKAIAMSRTVLMGQAQGAKSETDEALGLPEPKKEINRGGRRFPLTRDFDAVIKKHDVLAVLSQRETRRTYTEESMTRDELAFLLWAAMGTREETGGKKRQVPSGGGRYPLELYVFVNRVDGLAAGLYHYLALSHELEYVKPLEEQEKRITEAVRGKSFVGHAPLFFIWTAVPYRGEWHSGTRAMKPILLDAGHSCQNLYIACEAIGCGMCPVASYLQAESDRLLCLHHGSSPSELDEYVIYGAALGRVCQSMDK